MTGEIMNKLIFALVLCCFCLTPLKNFAANVDLAAPTPASPSKAEYKPKKAKYAKKIPSAATLKRLKYQAKKYTNIQVDTSLNRLPPKYFGNDPRALFTAIEKRKDKAEKSEFETIEQFQKRITNENSMPIIGKLSTDSLWSLQANEAKFEYSADSAEMNIYINFGFDGILKAISLSSVEINHGSYAASNSYGASTVVKSSDYESYAAAPCNYSEFPFKDTIGQHYIGVKIALDQNEAKNAKNDMKVLLIAKLADPLISEVERYHEATFSSPNTSIFSDRYIHINLNEIWIYNQKTGQIYSKIKRSNQNTEVERQ
jgi:hypothetical protein